MVVRNGQRLIVGCFPLIAVFHPVTCYRPIVENKAVVPQNSSMELSEMIYLFKAIARRDMGNTRKPISTLPVYTLRKQAESEEKVRAFFAPYYVILGGGHA